MSILNNIKKGVANSGSNKGKILHIRDGEKKRVRFLHEIEDGLEITHHDDFDSGIDFYDQEAINGERHPLEDDKDIRHRTAYIWSVWDYDAKEVKLFKGYANNFSPLPALIGMYESYETITDRDYVINRTGSQLKTSYTVVPMDKAKFKNKKAKPYTNKKMMEILDKAFPAPEDDDAESQDEEDDWDDDEEENEYEDMSPKELYMECIERGIKAKKKMKKKYYIDLLEEADEEDEEDEDDWEDEEDDDDEEW